MSDEGSDEPYELDITLSALRLLGEQLYSNVPKCISEAVANSWDADAEEVRIEVNHEDDTVKIIDDGRGMDKSDVNNKYLNVGYQKRKDTGDKSLEKERPVMGRKGVGKLALFGIANTIEVYTKKEGCEPQAFEIDAKAIREEIENSNPGQNGSEPIHSPPPISEEKMQENWPNDLDRGTVLRLTEIDKNINSITEDSLKSRLARRFSVLSQEDFSVYVNDYEIEVTDRDYFHKIEYLWIIGDPEIDYENLCDDDKLEGVTHISGEVNTVKGKEQVDGWIGSSDKPSDLEVNIGGETDENDDINKIHLIVRGKMAKDDMLSEISNSKHFTEYLFGDLHADFLDDTGEKDIHTTNREDFNREDWRYFGLRNYLSGKLEKISEDWDEYREEEGTEEAKEIEPVREWYDNLDDESQKKKARNLFGKINKMSPTDAEREEFYKFSVLAFERLRAKDNLRKIEEIDKDNLGALNEVFMDMEDIEAAQYYQIIKQRLKVVEKFEENVDDDVLEDTLQENLFDNLWLLDPSWERATGTKYQEKRVYKLFNKKKQEIDDKLSEDKKKGRVDLKYRKAANQHVIVELKRSERLVTQGELVDQVRKYKDAFNDVLEDCGRGEESVEVVVVVGRDPKGWNTPERKRKGKQALKQQDIKVVKYNELIENARATYGEYLERKNDLGKIEGVLESIENTIEKV